MAGVWGTAHLFDGIQGGLVQALGKEGRPGIGPVLPLARSQRRQVLLSWHWLRGVLQDLVQHAADTGQTWHPLHPSKTFNSPSDKALYRVSLDPDGEGKRSPVLLLHQITAVVYVDLLEWNGAEEGKTKVMFKT